MTVLLQLVIFGSITGVVAIILGGVLGFKVLPDALDDKLKDNVRLELSETYKHWTTPPFDVTTKIYFFDVKNSKDIFSGQNASVEQIGPIIYKQTKSKENIQYNSKLDTFTYDLMVSHTYDPDSRLKETDSVHTLNVLKYMSFAYCEEDDTLSRLHNSFIELFKDTFNDDIFHTINIKDFLINGYKCIPDSVKGKDNIFLKSSIVGKLKNNPRLKKTDKGYTFFAFRPMQNYIENKYEMQGGAKSITSQGNLISINGIKSLNIWPDANGSYCNSIRGTDSNTFPPDFDVDNGLSVYDNDLCRSVDYAFKKEVEVRDLSGDRMILMNENFAYPMEDNYNLCFCIEKDQKCIGNGFLDLTTCIKDIPFIASQPHFLYTDPEHAETLQFQPTVEEDVSFIDIQTESGTVLRASKKIQYNMWIRKVEGFTDDVKPFMLPLFWVEEYMEIPQQSVNILNDIYFDDLVMIEGVKWGLLVVGTVLVLLSAGAFIFSKLNLNSRS